MQSAGTGSGISAAAGEASAMPMLSNLPLQLAMKELNKCIESGVADGFLTILLEVMKLAFCLDHDYRKNIAGFSGRYLFRSVDHAICVGATFSGGEMHVEQDEVPDPDVTVVFKDGKALMGFLLSGNPDILGSMLRQEVTPEGNLNYLYKFAYLARRLQLMATGEA
jgi:hypothetical protein